MPVYDYECSHCNGSFSAQQSVKDEPLSVCLHCSREPTRVLLRAPHTVVPPNHQASPDKSKYYGITDVRTGAGITKNTNLADPPGIRVKNIT